jgi:hypothetical protein
MRQLKDRMSGIRACVYRAAANNCEVETGVDKLERHELIYNISRAENHERC